MARSSLAGPDTLAVATPDLFALNARQVVLMDRLAQKMNAQDSVANRIAEIEFQSVDSDPDAETGLSGNPRNFGSPGTRYGADVSVKEKRRLLQAADSLKAEIAGLEKALAETHLAIRAQLKGKTP